MNFNFEYLKHGKALCGKVFKRFVETFNFHNDFISNLKGDADLPTEGGHVNVDTTDPSHPVIRCKGCGGGSSSGGTSTAAPSPFEFTMVTPEPEEGEEEEPTGTPAIVNNTFYWDGVLKSLSNFTPPATCTVYLCCTQAAPSASGEAEWQFSIATSPAQATSGGRVVNYKLYDLSNYEVTMDYRTTFLELNSPHQVAYFKVAKPEAENTDPIVELSALPGNAILHLKNDSPDAKITVSDSKAEFQIADNTALWGHVINFVVDSARALLTMINGAKSLRLDPKDLVVGSEAKFHKLTVTHADGTKTEYDVVSDKDVEIYDASGTVLKDFTLEYTNYELQLTKTKVDLATGEETTEGPETVFTTEAHSAQS